MTAFAVALGARTFRSLRRHHNYRLFFAGQIVSLAGTWMQNVALAWLVLELSGSPLAVGALVFCRFLPFTLLVLLAGAIADRFDTRRLVMATQAAQMAVSVVLAAVTLTGTASLPIVFILAALSGITLVLDAPARQSLTFQLVGRNELPNAVALNSGLFNASRIVGPAVAGVVIAAAGTGVCFVVNAATFLAVLAALALMREEELVPVARDSRGVGVARGTREALAFAAADPELRGVLGVLTAVSLAGFNFHVLVPLVAAELDLGSKAFGLLSAAFGAGALAGALLLAALGGASRRGFAAGTIGFSLLMLALAPLHGPVTAAILLAAIGVCFTLLTANASAILQLRAPDHLRGRLISLYLLAFLGLTPLGGLLSGWMAAQWRTGASFTVAGVVGLVSIALAMRSWRTAVP